VRFPEDIEDGAALTVLCYLVRHAIQHASISRKHLIIEVSPVKPGDGVRLVFCHNAAFR
jgi:hypothetical protein